LCTSGGIIESFRHAPIDYKTICIFLQLIIIIYTCSDVQYIEKKTENKNPKKISTETKKHMKRNKTGFKQKGKCNYA